MKIEYIVAMMAALGAIAKHEDNEDKSLLSDDICFICEFAIKNQLLGVDSEESHTLGKVLSDIIKKYNLLEVF